MSEHDDYDILARLFRQNRGRPIMVFATDATTSTAHLLTVTSEDSSTVICGHDAPFDAWVPVTHWLAATTCRACVPTLERKRDD